MPVHLKAAPFERLSDTDLAAWQRAEAAAVSDCLERSMAMDGGIGPLAPTMRVVGDVYGVPEVTKL